MQESRFVDGAFDLAGERLAAFLFDDAVTCAIPTATLSRGSIEE